MEKIEQKLSVFQKRALQNNKEQFLSGVRRG